MQRTSGLTSTFADHDIMATVDHAGECCPADAEAVAGDGGSGAVWARVRVRVSGVTAEV